MIILDTNVVAEPMKPRANNCVIVWLDQQVAETLYFTATSLSELLVGIAFLPKGKRRDGLASALDALLRRLFGQRVLAFDREAAVAYSSLVAHARAVGHSVSVADAQIAAIARVHGLTVATRDSAPFSSMGISVVNPWAL